MFPKNRYTRQVDGALQALCSSGDGTESTTIPPIPTGATCWPISATMHPNTPAVHQSPTFAMGYQFRCLLSSLNTTILAWMCAVPSCFPRCASATASVRALYGSIDITTYRKCLRSIRRTITSGAKSSILLTAAGRHPYLAKQVVGEVALVEVERRAGIKGDPPVRVERYCRSPPIKLDNRHKL